jgi:hypothetical protein
MLSNIAGPKPRQRWWGCVRLVEPTTILVISMKMKLYEKSLGRNPLSDAPYRNPGMVLNGQGPGHHPLVMCLILIWIRC